MGTKRWLKWTLAATALVALAAVWLVWNSIVPDPPYHGKPLSHWLLGYQGDGTGDWDEADKAMNQFGSNAVPILLEWLQVRDTKLKLRVLALLEKQHVLHVNHVPAEQLNFAASIGFRKLGTAGASAAPKLVSIYSRNISSWSRSATVSALDDVAPYAVPALAKELARRKPREREMIVGVLARAESQPGAVVPVLTASLKDEDAGVRAAAAAGLSRFGTNAQSAVPALLELKKDSNAEASHAADYALERIAPGPQQAGQ